ncbi:MAG: hypothetical protein IT168_11465 [Bryobacterales bacterium]|nr:hypothetical protein [Bryobacterales bacterium]
MPYAIPVGLVVLALVLAGLMPGSVRSRLLHRLPEAAEEYFVVSRVPMMRGPTRITFRDVVILAEHARTVSYVRNYRGKWAVVRRKVGFTKDQIDLEIEQLLGGRVELSPLSGMWLLRMSFGEAVWLSVLVVYLWIGGRQTWRVRGERRYWAYGGVVLAAWALVGIVVWPIVAELVASVRAEWTLSAALYVTAATFYLAASAVAVYVFWQDLRLRCRQCLHRLRMPVEDGVTGSMVVDPSTEATVCIYGHGTRIVGRWQDTWTPAGSYWEELLKASAR